MVSSKDKLEKQIGCVKYTIFCLNIVSWIFGAAIFGVAIWMVSDTGFNEWVRILEIQVHYVGIYILMIGGVAVMLISFLGCVSALLENTFAIGLFIAAQILSFIILGAGSAILLEFSTTSSSVQPLMRNTLLRFIMRSEYEPEAGILRMIQENAGCCGADGPNDYILLRKPLPTECRDTVSGNAFFHGCIDELTWYLEDKSAWLSGIAMAVSLMNVINGVLGIILVQAIRKEEEEVRAAAYRR